MGKGWTVTNRHPFLNFTTMKKYVANSVVSINIVLPDGANKRVAFSPQMSGGSVFYTDDEDIQKGLERHWKYGKLFQETEIEEYKPAEQPAEVKADGPVVIHVSDPDAAKAHLAEHCGVSRTKLKSVKAIKETAALYNIEFEGI